MFCDNCGKSIPAGATSCTYCGQQSPASSASSGGVRERVQRLPKLTNAKIESGIAGFCAPAFLALEDGLVIRTLIALGLRIFGILIVLGGIYGLVDILKAAFSFPTAQATIGGVIFGVLLLAAAAIGFLILFYRAASISNLGDSQFTVIPIFSVIFRAWGELYAAFLAIVGVGGALFTWFTGFNPLSLLSEFGSFLPNLPLGGGGTFLDGLEFLIFMILTAFGSLIVFYFLAEAVLVAVDIAKNVRHLAERQSGLDTHV